jgi:Protein of unknown function (DUF3592)
MNQKTAPAWVYPLIFTALALPLLWMMFPALYQGYRSQHWASTEGVIKSATVTRHLDYQGVLYWIPVVHYSYEVGGASYQGSRLSFVSSKLSVSYNTRAGADAVTNLYSPGKHVTVYYDPSSPSNSALKAGLSKMAEEELVVPGAIIAFGLYSWFRRRAA